MHREVYSITRNKIYDNSSTKRKHGYGDTPLYGSYTVLAVIIVLS